MLLLRGVNGRAGPALEAMDDTYVKVRADLRTPPRDFLQGGVKEIIHMWKGKSLFDKNHLLQ